MSRAAVSARKEAAKRERRLDAAERFCAMAEYSSAIDSCVVRCDTCGLLNVTRQGLQCFGCGSEVGTSA